MRIKTFNYRILLFLVSVILFNSCRTNKEFGSTKKEYIMAYKKTVLYECINSATNNSLQKFSKDNNDLGIAPEVAIIFHSDVVDAQNVGIKLSKKIRTVNYSDHNGRKPIFSDCVDFAFSKPIDSIAILKYKKLKKGKLEYKKE